MMDQVREKISLKPFNTFGVEAFANHLVTVRSVKQLQALLAEYNGPLMILGGGSNLLLTKDVEALVLKNEIMGKAVVSEDERRAVVRAGSGENWHEFVRWTLARDLGGLENLSLIPGTVGAAPIQNIGAYGMELKEAFEKLEAVELATGKLHTFTAADCRFGYRDSIFKREYRGRFFITAVFLRLTKVSYHQLNLSYGAIRTTLDEMNIEDPGIRDVSEAVIRIRSSKLPDPAQLGNAGSFFKNPVIPEKKFKTIQQQFPGIVHYPAAPGWVKVPAGWLIEHSGWKGKRIGDAGSYEKQALVLVNYGKATGNDIHRLALQIGNAVREKFGIEMEMEVNVV